MLPQVEHVNHYGLMAIKIVLIVGFCLLAYLLIKRGLKILSQRTTVGEPLRFMILGFARWILIILAIILILQQLGVGVTGLWAALLTIAGMVAIGFIAVWSVLSNILCSIFMLIFRPFQIGDEIEIIEATGGSGLRGKVVNLNILWTFIKEKDSNGDELLVQVPNNVFFQKTFRRREGTVTESLNGHIFKGSPEDEAKKKTENPSQKEGLLKGPKPEAGQDREGQ